MSLGLFQWRAKKVKNTTLITLLLKYSCINCATNLHISFWGATKYHSFFVTTQSPGSHILPQRSFNPQKVAMWLQGSSTIVSCITFHIWKSVDCFFFSNKVYRGILRNYYVLKKTLKCLCTLYLKNNNLQIFLNEKLCMKL